MSRKRLPDTRERILFIFFSISDYVFREGLCLDYLKDIGERGKQKSNQRDFWVPCFWCSLGVTDLQLPREVLKQLFLVL